MFELLGFVVGFFILQSFEHFGIFHLNVLKFLPPDCGVQTFIRSDIDCVALSCLGFTHDGRYFLEKNPIFPFDFGESILPLQFSFSVVNGNTVSLINGFGVMTDMSEVELMKIH